MKCDRCLREIVGPETLCADHQDEHRPISGVNLLLEQITLKPGEEFAVVTPDGFALLIQNKIPDEDDKIGGLKVWNFSSGRRGNWTMPTRTGEWYRPTRRPRGGLPGGRSVGRQRIPGYVQDSIDYMQDSIEREDEQR